ncbi:MAG: Cro/C1-type HTH DNA-binding domain protein [Chaetfec virus UA24_244]|nr:MAG: Cro/C1-type HTH DNA-binding domain protein [Chaetfec virus UA24_244]
MTLQENIYNIMANKKMKQSLVARAAGYDPKTFNAMLRKRKAIKSDDILHICKALEVTPNVLFSWEEKK